MIKKNWLIIPLVITGFYYNFWTIQNADYEMVFQEFLYGGLLLIFLVFLGMSFNKDLKKNKNIRSWKNFIPTIFGILVLFSFVITNVSLRLRDHSPVIIKAGYDGDFNGAWFDFRKDGTYKFVNHGGVGADISRGNYRINDSIITLDKDHIGGVLKTRKLAIRAIKDFDSEKTKVMYQIDEQHKVIDKNFIFTVNEYKIDE